MRSRLKKPIIYIYLRTNQQPNYIDIELHNVSSMTTSGNPVTHAHSLTSAGDGFADADAYPHNADDNVLQSGSLRVVVQY